MKKIPGEGRYTKKSKDIVGTDTREVLSMGVKNGKEICHETTHYEGNISTW
jgi:hypothetical protein